MLNHPKVILGILDSFQTRQLPITMLACVESGTSRVGTALRARLSDQEFVFVGAFHCSFGMGIKGAAGRKVDIFGVTFDMGIRRIFTKASRWEQLVRELRDALHTTCLAPPRGASFRANWVSFWVHCGKTWSRAPSPFLFYRTIEEGCDFSSRSGSKTRDQSDPADLRIGWAASRFRRRRWFTLRTPFRSPSAADKTYQM